MSIGHFEIIIQIQLQFWTDGRLIIPCQISRQVCEQCLLQCHKLRQLIALLLHTSEGVCSKTWQVTDKHHCLHWYDQNTGYLLVVASLICEQVIINSDYSTHISVLYAQSRDPISQYQYCKYNKSFWASLLIKPCLNNVFLNNLKLQQEYH